MQQPQWSPEFNNGLTNHLPMAVQALQSMQASDSQINRLYAHLSPSLDVFVKPEDQQNLSEAQVKALTGKRSHYPALVHYFTQLLLNQTLEQQHIAISRWLAYLSPGLSAAAFHPMIRLAHAISNDSETSTQLKHYDSNSETANALAYWVYAYQELAWPENNLQCSASITTAIHSLVDSSADLGWPTQRLGKYLVTDDMLKVQQHRSFNDLVLTPIFDQISLAEMQEAILNLYLATDDFTILHGVTASYATSVIMDKYNTKLMLPYLWQGLVTAFLSKGINPLKIQETQQKLLNIKVLEIEEIKQRACHSLDSHTIKLAAVCLHMYKTTQNQSYLLAASRKIHNDKSAVLSPK